MFMENEDFFSNMSNNLCSSFGMNNQFEPVMLEASCQLQQRYEILIEKWRDRFINLSNQTDQNETSLTLKFIFTTN
jgi:hypothetical protein